MSKRDVDNMHALPVEEIDRTGAWCRHRRREDREAAVVELFDDEGGHESILDLGERRFPHVLVTLTYQSLCQTAK